MRVFCTSVEGGRYSEQLSAVNELSPWGQLPVHPPPGEYELWVITTLHLLDGPVTEQWREEFEVDLTVVGPGEDTVIPVVRPPLTESLQQAITIDWVLAMQHTDGSVELRFPVYLTELPVGVAFDILLVHAGKEWHAGAVAVRKGESGSETHNRQTIPWSDGDPIDVILRSNPQIARESLNVVEFWEGELLFEDVPVHTPDE